MQKIIETTCYNPAKILGLDHLKGGISKGKHADFIIWDPYNSFNFEKNEYVPYPETHIFLNKKFYGVVKKTYLRG